MSYVIKIAHQEDVWLKERGHYRPGVDAKGQRTASISCPRCGGVSSLSGHTIDAQGRVNPSVVCPYTRQGTTHSNPGQRSCDFHDFIVLEGWKERAP